MLGCFTAAGLGIFAVSLSCSGALPGQDLDSLETPLFLTGMALAAAATAALAARLWEDHDAIAASIEAAAAGIGKTCRRAASPLAGTVPTVNRLADAVRDTILDWSFEETPYAGEKEPLPPLDPRRLAKAMQGPVDKALRNMADILNEAADVESMAACRGEVRCVVEDLVRQALGHGEQIRIDAAVAAAGPTGPHGRWVEKYRRMRAREGRFVGQRSSS
jgi:hypothetical protein